MKINIKKIGLILMGLLLLQFSFMFIHEFGHYIVAEEYGFNPSMHFFASAEGSKGGIAYTSYSYQQNEQNDIIERKILFAGHYFEMILLAVITGVSLILVIIKKEWLLCVLLGIVFIMMVSFLIDWNVFNPLYDSDLYYLLMGFQ